ncbi:NAD-dependent epimerase/dehydratase family protein [Eubacteriaceae bacterium ES2]|nr:NAD-dependent epimerase/dehydratase family protein [Eubacteriaceae bacterium ES2]
MNILVTGGTGFIGEYFIPQLLEKGHKVRLLVRNIQKAKKLFGEDCEYFVGDVTNKESLNGCCENIEIIYHMVAKVGNEIPSEENLEAFRKVNVEGTRNIIEESTKNDISRFIFISSIAAMGIVKEHPITEVSKCSPYLPYQISKYEAEQLVRNETNKGKLKGVIVRPTKVYGIGEHEYSFLTLAKLCKKRVYLKVGKGENYNSNIYVTDLVQGLMKLIGNGNIGETYILTSEASISFIEIGKIISKTIEKKIVYIQIPSKLMVISAAIEERICNILNKKPIVTKRNIEATINDRIYDIKKAKAEFGFKPEVSMEDGIVKTVTWYKEIGLI